jgi:hypothetical protein
MWKRTVGIATAVALWSGGARAAGPADVQDPPGSVDVNQPADVSLGERDTPRDTTDTLHGARTEVIESEGEGAAPGSAGGAQWREVAPGGEARASFDEEQEEAEDPATGAADDRMPGTVYSDDTLLGTDQGYGTGTEPAPAPAR